ncbi:MAG: hypothetical protein K6B70_07395 [Clostridia bacterium]|nr:hypothetical protein [Clostridia bacterium]
MEKETNQNFKKLDQIILTRQDKTPIYRQTDVKVKQISVGKNGPEYEILDEEDKRIGFVKDDNTFVFDPQYKEELKKKMGMMFEVLGFDEQKIESDVKEKIKEQEEKNKENKVVQKETEKTKSPEKKQEEPKKDKEKEDNSLTEKELKAYNNVKIKDFEFVADMISPNEYNIYDTYFINKDGKFHMMALNMSTGKYEEVEEYLRKDLAIGKQDTLEKNREETDIGIAQKVTYKDRYGDRLELNFNQLDSGEIEARVSHRHREGSKTGDIDRDGDEEGIKIATDRDRVNPKVKKFDHIKDDINEVKEENYIESDEINDGELSITQIKEVIAQKIEEEVISEKDEMEVIQLISTRYPSNNPTLEQLEELIEEYALNREQKEIEHDDEDEELEPGYTRGPDGVLRFRGMPIE